jgi:hypothetical protein
MDSFLLISESVSLSLLPRRKPCIILMNVQKNQHTTPLRWADCICMTGYSKTVATITAVEVNKFASCNCITGTNIPVHDYNLKERVYILRDQYEIWWLICVFVRCVEWIWVLYSRIFFPHSIRNRHFVFKLYLYLNFKCKCELRPLVDRHVPNLIYLIIISCLRLTVYNFLVDIFSNHRVSITNLTTPLHFYEKDEGSLNVAWAKNINFTFLSFLIQLKFRRRLLLMHMLVPTSNGCYKLNDSFWNMWTQMSVLVTHSFYTRHF